jgi:hypothetical protein
MRTVLSLAVFLLASCANIRDSDIDQDTNEMQMGVCPTLALRFLLIFD